MIQNAKTVRHGDVCDSALAGALVLTTAAAYSQTGPSVAHLEKRGAATQLIVDGKPFLALAGELTNTAASSPEHMKMAWPHLLKVGLNTVLAPIAWAWIEPEEGRYDFTFADNIIRDARANKMRIIRGARARRRARSERGVAAVDLSAI